MPISMPTTTGFTDSVFYLQTNSQEYTSPLNKVTQAARLEGELWVARYELPYMKRAEAAEWRSFFLKLQGRLNTFNGFDPEGRTPRGVATGTPLVNGGAQTGYSLITDGWTISTTGILKAGDYINVNNELKQVTDDVDSDGSGNATINFQPPLRNSPSDNATITVFNTTVEMRLDSDDFSAMPTNKNGIYRPISFSAKEVI